jgi:amino acid adenylation domain-containing protein
MKNVADIYPLTPTQAGMLYHALSTPQEGLYFQQISCTLRGSLNLDLFKQAWDLVVKRHPALRTIFLWEGVNEPLQVVRETINLPWDVVDLRGASPQDQAERLVALRDEYRARGFDLTRAPILSMVLVQLADDRYHFIWNFHHLLTDGWSTHLVFQEALAVYEALGRGEQYTPPPVRPFREYVDWLRRQDAQAAGQFWREQLAGFEVPTSFQVDRPAKSGAVLHGEASRTLSAAETIGIQSFARQHRLTLSTIVHGAWALLLSCYSGEEDVVFGTTLSGRPADLRGVENMIGMFINTLPLRVRTPDSVRLLPWLQQLQAQQLEIRQVEYSSLAEVQRLGDVEPGSSLFESILVFENYPVQPNGERSLVVEDIRYREQSNYPLALLVLPEEQMRLLVIYDRSRFDAGVIDRMLIHLQTILLGMTVDPDMTLSDIPLIDAEEYRQTVIEWNETDADPGPLVWIHDQVAAMAAYTPQKTAVTAGNGSLTYGELEYRATQLAHHLLRRGIEPGTPIGLYMDRSTTMIVGILGILKAGCAYVPLDPAYPASRVEFILNDTRTPMVVTQPHHTVTLGLPEGRILVLDEAWSQITAEPDQSPGIPIKETDLAYIIYTSGSTGDPKGVMVTHGGLFYSNAARFLYYEGNVGNYLLLSSFAFDSSVAGIFWTLADGGTLVLPDPGDERDIDRLVDLIAEQQITHTLALPSLYRLLLDFAPPDSLDSLRTVIVAGEACPSDLASRHYAFLPGAVLYNEYGPTEGTVWASVYRLERDDDLELVPIGKPIPNARLYILDRRGRPVPVGVPGELVIGGPSVVPGYWQHPELTAERFARNPFGEGRIYRTGDRVRWLPDGNLEFLGRVDNQVKVRGYRIELGEIEIALRQHTLVSDALVTLKGGRLLAYLIPSRNGDATLEGLEVIRSDLAGRLPEYMLPSFWTWLAEFPRTPNGKIDRKSLPEPDPSNSSVEVEPAAPRTDTEQKIQSIWKDLLGVQKIGTRDDFFMLGGHSLLMTQLVSRLRQAFNVSLPLSAVVDVRTIAGQAERIETLIWNTESVVSASSVSQGGREEFEI